MKTFLDMCKEKLPEAERRFQAAAAAQKEGQVEFQAASQKFQKIQMEHNVAAQEFNSLNVLIAAESRKAAVVEVAFGPQPEEKKPEVAIPSAIHPTDTNKTDLIRDLLRNHPTGMTPVEVWRVVKEQIPHRAYIYSVLGRLKDRGQVTVNRRGKYFCVPKTEEAKQESTIQ